MRFVARSEEVHNIIYKQIVPIFLLATQNGSYDTIFVYIYIYMNRRSDGTKSYFVNNLLNNK